MRSSSFTQITALEVVDPRMQTLNWRRYQAVLRATTAIHGYRPVPPGLEWRLSHSRDEDLGEGACCDHSSVAAGITALFRLARRPAARLLEAPSVRTSGRGGGSDSGDDVGPASATWQLRPAATRQRLGGGDCAAQAGRPVAKSWAARPPAPRHRARGRATTCRRSGRWGCQAISAKMKFDQIVVLVAPPLARRLANVRPVAMLPAHIGQPRQALRFERVLRHGLPASSSTYAA